MFQFTRPRGARQYLCRSIARRTVFQFTRPRGARPFVSRTSALSISFQFTRPRGARPGAVHSPQCWYPFQFTRPRGARPLGWGKATLVLPFQFTRPRGARPTGGPRCIIAHVVSIHAPARGATLAAFQVARTLGFNSRAREGRDMASRSKSLIADMFQFTRPRGARRDKDGTSMSGKRVSIHAPARGATVALCLPLRPVRKFQFTRPRGARLVRFPSCAGGVAFQFTRPRGARRARKRRTGGRRGFNSRAREGRDSRFSQETVAGQVFQFTRPRGARLPLILVPSLSPVSIHAPARGATCIAWAVRCVPMFQFTRPRGARPLVSFGILKPFKFQFTRPRGARPRRNRDAFAIGSFNSRAREGRDVTYYGNDGGVICVSIHAPARGATMRSAFRLSCLKFQFTRPRGARRPTRFRSTSQQCFNSRAREGRDSQLRLITLSQPKFQFTRPRGARQMIGLGAQAVWVSIHAPARGATWQRMN